MSARTNSTPDVVRGRDDVDADHPVHARVSAEATREESSEVAGDPGHEHH
jgi:hypothetical protein